MTVSGSIGATDVPPPAKLIPASMAQEYIADLEEKLVALDGAPLYLIEDGETGASDDLVLDAKVAIEQGRPSEQVPLFTFLDRCFENGWHFRIWLADDHPDAHTRNVVQVGDAKAAVAAMKRGGVFWNAG